MTETALIVGAGSGLSAALARLFAKEGMRVALAARDGRFHDGVAGFVEVEEAGPHERREPAGHQRKRNWRRHSGRPSLVVPAIWFFMVARSDANSLPGGFPACLVSSRVSQLVSAVTSSQGPIQRYSVAVSMITARAVGRLLRSAEMNGASRFTSAMIFAAR